MKILKFKKWGFPFAVILVMIPTIVSQAQDIDIQNRLNAGSPVKINRRPQEQFEGQHYFDNDWNEGRILLKSGKKSKRMKLRYDIYKHRVEFKRKGKILAVKPKTFTGIELQQDGKEVLFRNGFSSPEYKIRSNHLLQVIYNGKVKLLKQYEVDLNRGSSPDPYTGIIKSYFRTKQHYFLLDNSGKYHKVNLKKDDILGALSFHQNELKTYAKSKDLNFDHPQDLKKILQEYDKMIAKAQ